MCISLQTASPVSGKMGPAGSVSASPKAFNPGLVPKQERTAGTGGILNLNLGQYQKHRHVIILYGEEIINKLF